MEWQGYNNSNVYEASQLAEALKEAFEDRDIELVESNKIEYFNIPASFDIETSSFIASKDENGEPVKAATMYIWQLGLNGTVIYGRTWDEFDNVINELVDYLELSSKRHLLIYVHNLGYEFQFIRKRFIIVKTTNICRKCRSINFNR